LKYKQEKIKELEKQKDILEIETIYVELDNDKFSKKYKSEIKQNN